MLTQEKICGVCLLSKPLSDYNKNRAKRDGLNHACRACSRLYGKKHYQGSKPVYLKRTQRNRQRVLKELREFLWQLKDVPCADCGNKFHPVAMDFDHVTGEKIREISRLANGLKRATLLAELKKCEVVCSNCHRVRTWNRLQEKKRLLPLTD